MKQRARAKQSCRGKRRFRDHREAIHALQKVRSSSVRETIPVRVYQCHRCEGWHLTSQVR